MKNLFLFCLIGGTLLAGNGGARSALADKGGNPNPVYVIKTSLGDMEVELFAAEAPKTVANFVGLAEGSKEFVDPKSGQKVKRPYYDGLAFHRVIKDFMIQGGCPLGNGTGGPGYQFEDEINAVALGLDKQKALSAQGRPHPSLMIQSQADFQRLVIRPLLQKLGIGSQQELDQRRAEVQRLLDESSVLDVLVNMGYRYSPEGSPHPPVRGALAMANAGPNTNGSQFFINLVDTEWLAGRHTVFGRVVQGLEVLDRIGQVAVGPDSRPVQDAVIVSIRKKP